MMILQTRLPVQQFPIVELLHLPRLSTRLSTQITPTPNPNSGNLTHLMVPTLTNSTLLSSSANSTSEIVQIYFQMIQLTFSFLKGSALDCFEPILLDPNEPN